MTRGRKPLPTVAHALHGNPGRRKPPAAEPKPRPVGMPKPPAFLDRTGAAEWRRLTGELAALQMITVLDLGILTGWCVAWSSFINATKKLAIEGEVIAAADGQTRRNPWLFVRSRAQQDLLRIASEFGMTPAARPRIGRALAGSLLPALGGTGTGAPTDALAAFLAADPRLPRPGGDEQSPMPLAEFIKRGPGGVD